MHQLRPHLDEQQFLVQVQRQQQESGYTLVFVSDSPLPAGGSGEVGEERNNPNLVTLWHMVAGIHWKYAREMRKEPTQAEKALWPALSARQLGYHFRRQHPLGPFIADFYCAKLGLVIEVDGETHNDVEAQAYDRVRDEIMLAQGLTVLRLTDADVLFPGGNALEKINAVIASKTSPTPPAGRGESDVVHACAGYRIAEYLAWGKALYVDDLVADESARGQGYASQLFDWLIERAREANCDQFHLDSGTGPTRFRAHRFYLHKGMDITSHHFAMKLK